MRSQGPFSLFFVFVSWCAGGGVLGAYFLAAVFLKKFSDLLSLTVVKGIFLC